MSNINIKISEIMSQDNGVYEEEDNVIRIPKVLREQMGLSVGQDITLTSVRGAPVVLTINPAYKADADTDSNYCYVSGTIFNLVNIANQCPVEKIESITLGCDPEFFLVDNQTRQLLRASSFFKKWGEIGHDGMLVELRPRPATNPGILTDNLYELITQTRQILNLNLNNYDPNRIMLFGASSYDTGLQHAFGHGSNIHATAGFHLHFGLPKKLLGSTAETINAMCKISNVMDYYVGIPAIIAEQTNDYRRRNNTCVSYGKPGDFRLDNRTFEYRVPGGSLLRHPALTYGLINLGSFVITDVINKLKGETNDFEDIGNDKIDIAISKFYPEIPDLNALFNIMCSPSVSEAEKLIGGILENLSNMIGFGEKEKDIISFFNVIKNSEHINNNIEANWRETYDSQPDICRRSHTENVDCAGSKLFKTESQPHS
jgi:hypothetical protein